jgi:hypothetical protein
MQLPPLYVCCLEIRRWGKVIEETMSSSFSVDESWYFPPDGRGFFLWCV